MNEATKKPNGLVLHRVQRAEGAERHQRERERRHAGAAEPVGELAAERPGDGADERAEEAPGERELGVVEHLRRLEERGERGRVADERAERADVEHRHDPGLAALAAAATAPGSDLASARLSMKRNAQTAAMTASGM
jgi:hypothetical protein